MHNDKLHYALKSAKLNVPFYAHKDEISETDLSSFPIIDKNMLLNKPHDFISSAYTKFDIKQMLCLRTSGTSTGHPLEIYWNQNDYIRSSICIWKLRRKWYNIRVDDRYVCFHTFFYSWNRASDKEKAVITSKNNL